MPRVYRAGGDNRGGGLWPLFVTFRDNANASFSLITVGNRRITAGRGSLNLLNIAGKWRDVLSAHFELQGGKSGRLVSMEGLRGLAILLVFLCHYYDIVWRDLPSQSDAFSQMGRILMAIGGSGVDLFFVLSGFLIYGAVRRPCLNILRFVGRRALRIYPAFLSVLVFYLAISPFLHQIATSPARYSNRITGTWAGVIFYVFENVLFLPGVFPVAPIMNVAWSLSYEWAFYLLLPLFIRIFRIYEWNRKTRIGFFLSLAVVFLASNIFYPAIFYLSSNPRQPSHVRAVMFIAGILLFELVELPIMQRYTKRVDFAAIVLASGAVAAAAALVAREHLIAPDPRIARMQALVSTTFFLGYSALVLAALLPGLVGRLLSWDCIRWLGNMSYSFYLVHGIPLHVFGIVAARLHASHLAQPLLWAVFVAALPLIFLVTLAAGAALFLGVEKPISLGGKGASNHVTATTPLVASGPVAS
jgi:exopolysaccharide production protein ExoZ